MEKANGGEILYQGHGSLRITTSCGTVVYVDPYLGEGYDRPADLILVTHQHHDHTAVDRPARKEDCVLWQNMDALQNGVYNMGPKEAGECARLIGAAHVVPYHMAPGKLFDRQRAQELEAAGRMIVEPGETIRL